jgi:NADH-quinone oxidoreductase subunit J
VEAFYFVPEVLFYILSGLILLSSVMVVSARNPVTSAIFLVLDLFFIAALYAKLDAHFTAAIQVLVYAGAIVVLFVFVIMLLNLKPEALRGIRFSVGEAAVLLITLAGFVIVGSELAHVAPDTLTPGELGAGAIELAGGNTYVVAMRMFTAFLWPFEMASVLILLAIVACVMIAKKDKVLSAANNLGGGSAE